jgi:PTS system glucitol/sorbitol-specific IIA component
MANQLWSTTVDRLGELTHELIEGGCYILFGEPLPEALAEISIVHRTRQAPHRPIAAGDLLELGGVQLRLDEVGDLANVNLTDLGHVVVYVNSPEQPLLPGAVKASGASRPQPTVGSTISFLGD